MFSWQYWTKYLLKLIIFCLSVCIAYLSKSRNRLIKLGRPVKGSPLLYYAQVVRRSIRYLGIRG